MREPGGSTISNLRNAFRFAQWAMSLPKPPTKHQIMAFLNCTGPTAKRWRNAWLETLPTPFSRDIPGGNRNHNNQELP